MTHPFPEALTRRQCVLAFNTRKSSSTNRRVELPVHTLLLPFETRS